MGPVAVDTGYTNYLCSLPTAVIVTVVLWYYFSLIKYNLFICLFKLSNRPWSVPSAQPTETASLMKPTISASAVITMLAF